MTIHIISVVSPEASDDGGNPVVTAEMIRITDLIMGDNNSNYTGRLFIVQQSI